MLSTRPIMISPYVYNMLYWVQKEKFQYDEDIYNEWVAFAVERGSFSYEIGEAHGTASFGDIVICPPHIPFRRVAITPLTFYVLRMEWTAADRRCADLSPHELREFIPNVKISIADTERLQRHYAAMRRAASLTEPERMVRIRHACFGIWMLHCDEADAPDLLSDTSALSALDPLVQRAHALIHQRAYESLNLKDIAASLNISAVQLTKKFKAAYGVTPIHYLTMLRMNKIKKLLLETTLTIDQISECCGYQNGFYLSRIFVRYEKLTPSHYRKLHQV